MKVVGSSESVMTRDRFMFLARQRPGPRTYTSDSESAAAFTLHPSFSSTHTHPQPTHTSVLTSTSQMVGVLRHPQDDRTGTSLMGTARLGSEVEIPLPHDPRSNSRSLYSRALFRAADCPLLIWHRTRQTPHPPNDAPQAHGRGRSREVSRSLAS